MPKFEIGDTVDVHCRILEGDKERIQIFNGVVIARSGSGTREMFTVRRIVQGEGVERKFPLHSPRIAKIEVKRSGVVRRAKLYYPPRSRRQGRPPQGTPRNAARPTRRPEVAAVPLALRRGWRGFACGASRFGPHTVPVTYPTLAGLHGERTLAHGSRLARISAAN